MKTPPMIKPVPQVLAELDAQFPALAQNAELDRNWVWLAVDLRGDHNKAIREAIGRQGIGFQFAPRGHALPSGKNGTWAHHAAHPVRFKFKGKAKPAGSEESPEPVAEFSDDQLLAALG